MMSLVPVCPQHPSLYNAPYYQAWDNISEAGSGYFEQAFIDQTVYVYHTYPQSMDHSDEESNDVAVFKTKFVLEDRNTS